VKRVFQGEPLSAYFPGQYQDEEINLYYNYHRTYAPAFGRYLTIDPLNLATIQIQIILHNLTSWLNTPKFTPLNQRGVLQETTVLRSIFASPIPDYILKDPQMQNLFIYTTNNPINNTDPAGLEKKKELDPTCYLGCTFWGSVFCHLLCDPFFECPVSWAACILICHKGVEEYCKENCKR